MLSKVNAFSFQIFQRKMLIKCMLTAVRNTSVMQYVNQAAGRFKTHAHFTQENLSLNKLLSKTRANTQ